MSKEHAEFWAAVARREAAQWECLSAVYNWNDPRDATEYLLDIYMRPQNWTLRRKPRTIVVNGVECVAGYVGGIEEGTEVAIPTPRYAHGYDTVVWFSNLESMRRLVGAYIGPDKETPVQLVSQCGCQRRQSHE